MLVTAMLALAACADEPVLVPDANGLVGDSRNRIEQNPDDAEKYYVYVYAPRDTVLVYVTNTGARQEATVGRDGYVRFNVPLSCLMPTEPVAGTEYTATPLVYMRNSDGTETQVRTGTVQVPVPALDITFTTGDTVTAVDGIANIYGSVAQSGVSITLDGNPVSVGADGSFSAMLEFFEVGDVSAVLEARLAGYQIHRTVFHITVESVAAGENPIQMPYEYGDTSYSQRTTGQSLNIWGRVPKGYGLTASSSSEHVSVSAEPTVDADGNFSFAVTVAQTGSFPILLTTISPGGTQYTREIFIQRAPDWRAYVESAWAMDYNAFLTPSDRGYEIKGTVTSILEQGDILIATFTLTDGNVITIEYHNHYGSASALTEGAQYNRIYGHPLGMGTDGTPHFFVWFVLNG